MSTTFRRLSASSRARRSSSSAERRASCVLASSRRIRSCACTRAISSRGRNGLRMKSAAPSPKVFSVISSGESDETMSTGMSRQRESALSSCRSCTPSVPGMITSSRSRSGVAFCSSKKSVSRPVADETSKPESRRTPLSDSRTLGSSSATRMRARSRGRAPGAASRPSHSMLPPERMHTVRAARLDDALEQRRDGDRAARFGHELVPVEQEPHRAGESASSATVTTSSRNALMVREVEAADAHREQPVGEPVRIRPGSSRARRPRARG